MKTVKILLSGILVCFTMFAQSQSLSSDISVGLKAGNVKLISKHFAESVDVSIFDKSNVYSSSEAEKELSEFFRANPPKDFTPIHAGERTGSSYVIGRLITETGEFRITCYARKVKENYLINQLKVERFE